MLLPSLFVCALIKRTHTRTHIAHVQSAMPRFNEKLGKGLFLAVLLCSSERTNFFFRKIISSHSPPPASKFETIFSSRLFLFLVQCSLCATMWYFCIGLSFGSLRVAIAWKDRVCVSRSASMQLIEDSYIHDSTATNYSHTMRMMLGAQILILATHGHEMWSSASAGIRANILIFSSLGLCARCSLHIRGSATKRRIQCC